MAIAILLIDIIFVITLDVNAYSNAPIKIEYFNFNFRTRYIRVETVAYVLNYVHVIKTLR